MYKVDVYYINHKHLSLSRLTNVLCSAWNLNQVLEFFIKRISCTWWKINVKVPGNLLPITEFHSINILFNQNSCLNETVKMAWVIFKVGIIFPYVAFFFEIVEQGKKFESWGPYCLFGEGATVSCCGQAEISDVFQSQGSKVMLSISSSDNSQNLMTQEPLKLP